MYLFFDEAGDLDFGKTGTKYFLCGILATRDPWPLMRRLTEVRERVFRGGFIPQAFHASEDKQAVRDEVFSAIRDWGDFEMHMTVLDKAGAPATHRDRAVFYAFVADLGLRLALLHYPSDDPIYVITDTLPVAKKREAVVKGFKASLAASLPGRTYQIEHQASGAQAGLQAADYVTWAVFKKWERGDLRSYGLINGFVVSETAFDWTVLRT